LPLGAKRRPPNSSRPTPDAVSTSDAVERDLAPVTEIFE
jgi:hypothetical protein